jgi:glutamyl-tRNA reductase
MNWIGRRTILAMLLIVVFSATGRLLPPVHRHRTNHHTENRSQKKLASVFVRVGVPRRATADVGLTNIIIEFESPPPI